VAPLGSTIKAKQTALSLLHRTGICCLGQTNDVSSDWSLVRQIGYGVVTE